MRRMLDDFKWIKHFPILDGPEGLSAGLQYDMDD